MRGRTTPAVADPARFRRHAIGALDAFLAGDGDKLIGHLDGAIAALARNVAASMPERPTKREEQPHHSA